MVGARPRITSLELNPLPLERARKLAGELGISLGEYGPRLMAADGMNA